MLNFILDHGLDIFTTLLGLVYIWLEYRAHIALWFVSILMSALDILLYWQHGLYGDAGMATYYTLAGIYGYMAWRYSAIWKKLIRKNAPATQNATERATVSISHMPRRQYVPVCMYFLSIWALTCFVLTTWTNSTVPVLDAFTNALSFVGLWALAKKYIEQWLFWIAVDAVCFYLYICKGIPFKAMLYGLYVVIAVAGYFKWKKMMTQDEQSSFPV